MRRRRSRNPARARSRVHGRPGVRSSNRTAVGSSVSVMVEGGASSGWRRARDRRAGASPPRRGTGRRGCSGTETRRTLWCAVREGQGSDGSFVFGSRSCFGIRHPLFLWSARGQRVVEAAICRGSAWRRPCVNVGGSGVWGRWGLCGLGVSWRADWGALVVARRRFATAFGGPSRPGRLFVTCASLDRLSQEARTTYEAVPTTCLPAGGGLLLRTAGPDEDLEESVDTKKVEILLASIATSARGVLDNVAARRLHHTASLGR